MFCKSTVWRQSSTPGCSPAPCRAAGLLPEPPWSRCFLRSGMVLSPPGGPLIPAVPAGRVVPVLAAALAALDVDRREVAPSQHPQGLAEAERQAVALADEAWRGCKRTRTALLPWHPDGYQALHPPPWVLPEETLPPTERPPSSPRTNPGARHPVGCVRREQPRPHQQQGLQESVLLPVPRSARLLAPPEPGRARRGCSTAQPPRHARLVCRLASVLCLDSSFPPFSVYTKTGVCITGSHTAVQNI